MLVCVRELQRLRERDRLHWLERRWVFTLRFMRGLSQQRAGETDGVMVEDCFFQSVPLPAPLRSLNRPFICFCWSYFNDLTFLSNSRVCSSANDCASVSGTHSRTPVNKHFVCKCLSLVPAVRLFYFLLFCHFPFWLCNLHGPKLTFCYVFQKSSLNLEFNCEHLLAINTAYWS